MINFENMATNVNNAERLRSYFLSHKQRENIINVCRARPNWDGCDFVTYIQVQGFHVGSKMINIIVAN